MSENNVKITFEGWVADLFIRHDGSLGITVEKALPQAEVPRGMVAAEEAAPGRLDEDNPCVDIFVSHDLEVSSV